MQMQYVQGDLDVVKEFLGTLSVTQITQVLPASWVLVTLSVFGLLIIVALVVGSSRRKYDTPQSGNVAVGTTDQIYKVRLCQGEKEIDSWEAVDYDYQDGWLEINLKDGKRTLIVPADNQHIIIREV
jgi:hypothetical protein